MKVQINLRSVADPYNFYTYPDPGCEKIPYGSGSRTNFDTNPDPAKNIRIRIQEKRIKHQEKLKNVIEKTLISHVLSVFYLTITIILLIF